MFKKKKENERAEQFSSYQSPMSYPVGQAAQMLGISKRTLIRHASAMGLEFEWDGRGRRIRRDDLQRLQKEGVVNNKKSILEAESDARLNAVDEDNLQAAYDLELPISIRVWQRLPSGKGTMLKGDLFCDETYGLVHELIKQKYGSGEYLIRPIENGVLSKKRYIVKLEGTPKIQSWKGIQMENKNNKEAFNFSANSENSQAKKDKQISTWVNFLRCWWPLAELQLRDEKCFLTFEEFISARRSFKQFLDSLAEDELQLITSMDAYEMFKSHLRRLCSPREQGDDDASFSNQDTQRIEEMLQAIREEMKHFYQEQSEKNTLLLFLCALCLILLLAPILAQQAPQLT